MDIENEKTHKKSVRRRTFDSAPNLSVDKPKIKKGAMFVKETGNDIKKYKELVVNLKEDKANNKQKQDSKKKIHKKKLNSKEVSKILMEPIKAGDTTEKKDPNELQFLIKKSIVQLMNDARNLKKGGKPQTKPESAKGNKPVIAKSENIKEPRTVAPGSKLNPKQTQNRIKTAIPSRKITNPQEYIQRQRPVTTPPILQKAKHQNRIGKSQGILENLFKNSQPIPSKNRGDKRLNLMFARKETESKINEENDAPDKIKSEEVKIETKSSKNKKSKIPVSDINHPPEISEVADKLKELKTQATNKMRASSSNPKTLPIIKEPTPNATGIEKKKRKSQKLVYTVST